MDLLDRVAAFLAAEAIPPTDSLPALASVRGVLSQVYSALARDPARAPQASALLAELTTEYERLLRQVGAEALASALSGEAPSGRDAAPKAPEPNPEPVASSTTLAEEARASASAEPVSAQAVQQWAERYRSREPQQSPSPALLLHAMVERLGPPPERLDVGVERGLEIERLDEALSGEALGELRQLPSDAQRAYLRLVTARLNAIREVAGTDVFTRERANRLLGTIRDYTREHRPGAIYGLASAHEPRSGTWHDEAAHLWRRIAGEAVRERARGSPPVSAHRRSQDEPDEGDGEAALAHAPEPDWPLWPVVRGKRALMMGGSPRESARTRIEQAFAMRELVWSADDPRKAQSAEARIEAGGHDLVLVLLRFVSHGTCERLMQACAARQVPCALIEHGYGVAAIRRALERFLLTRSASAASAK